MQPIPTSRFVSASAAAPRSVPAPTKRHGRGVVVTLSCALGLVLVWALAASWYLLFHDEMLARFVTQQRTMQAAYEERLGTLQLQIDRHASDRLLSREAIETRLTAMSDRQALIEKRQSQVAGLGGADVETTSSIAAPAYAPAPAPPQKPFPTPDPLGLRMQGGDRVEASDKRLPSRMTALDLRLDRAAERQRLVLGGIGERALRKADRLREAIVQVGLDPSRFEPSERGTGGPFVPVTGDAFDIVLAQAQRWIGDEAHLRRAVATIPLRKPLIEDAALTSGFGTRLDPFTRGLALHTGVDMKADYGAAARATAAGRVSAAETAGGYGKMVEIDHGHGLSTRYAHLSGYAVAPGQWVEAGTVVGRVGSTGRSTGNHLHYETRIDGEPVDPQRFLRAGSTLTAE